jgi:hypothetical protein
MTFSSLFEVLSHIFVVQKVVIFHLDLHQHHLETHKLSFVCSCVYKSLSLLYVICI